MSGISLWQIETALVDLAEERDRIAADLSSIPDQASVSEYVRENLNQQLAIIDAAILDFIRKEITKVDNIADYAMALDSLCHEPRERAVDGVKVMERCEIDREIDRLVERRNVFRGRLERIKDACKAVMEVMPWKPGKTRKLEGVRHSITLQGNGGREPVEIHDETLLPVGLLNYTITIPGDLWVAIEKAIGTGPLLEMISVRARVKSEPALSRIFEALAVPCGECSGTGSAPCPVHGHSDIEQYEGSGNFICGTCGDEGKGDAADRETCQHCGGSGKAGVPGARLGVRGESVRIR